jgi:hypothetical protein
VRGIRSAQSKSITFPDHFELSETHLLLPAIFAWLAMRRSLCDGAHDVFLFTLRKMQ